MSDHATRIIKNFLLVMAGTGKVEHDDEENPSSSRLKREDLGNPGTRVDVAQVQRLLQVVPSLYGDSDNVRQNAISKRIEGTLAIIQRLLQGDNALRNAPVLEEKRAKHAQRPLPDATAKAKAKAKAKAPAKLKAKGLYREDYQTAYESWCQELKVSKKPPYQAQWDFMKQIHRRCEQEAKDERSGDVKKQKSSEPMRLFCHGLPGSGKTQVMKWLASYFEKVWNWTAGEHFVFLAPMNSMAFRINGFTLHSWGNRVG